MNQTTSCIRFCKHIAFFIEKSIHFFQLHFYFIFCSLQTLYPDARIKCISDSAFFVNTPKNKKHTFLDRLREVDNTHMLKGVSNCVKELSLSSTSCILQTDCENSQLFLKLIIKFKIFANLLT